MARFVHRGTARNSKGSMTVTATPPAWPHDSVTFSRASPHVCFRNPRDVRRGENRPFDETLLAVPSNGLAEESGTEAIVSENLEGAGEDVPLTMAACLLDCGGAKQAPPWLRSGMVSSCDGCNDGTTCVFPRRAFHAENRPSVAMCCRRPCRPLR